MTLLIQLKQLQTLEQQRQELLQTLTKLEQQQEDLARLILHSPNCPHEAHVSIDSQTIAWIDHSDDWDNGRLRSAIKFHELTYIGQPDNNETPEESNPYLLSGEELERAENQLCR
ncbi:MAG: hypothetical protein KME43_21320 [Myxacorys chilensis ATA2-1-KO14]|jgi:dTDP-4-amino-4,6-dideoxygalactose transaminase|nr:hypothetical protein [Myxacorys chilensis ATA2-1-KO14]